MCFSRDQFDDVHEVDDDEMCHDFEVYLKVRCWRCMVRALISKKEMHFDRSKLGST